MRNRIIANVFAGGVFCLGLGAINLQAEEDPQGPSPTYSIGGRVMGAAGPVALQNSNGTIVIVAQDGSFTFETPMVSSAIYNVTVAVAPNSQDCRVAHGAGTVESRNISDVIVICSSNAYTAGNRVTGEFP